MKDVTLPSESSQVALYCLAMDCGIRDRLGQGLLRRRFNLRAPIDDETRLAAVERITDEEMLASIAVYSRVTGYGYIRHPVQVAAAKRLQDQKLIERVARNASCLDIALAAIGQSKRIGWLLGIASFGGAGLGTGGGNSVKDASWERRRSAVKATVMRRLEELGELEELERAKRLKSEWASGGKRRIYSGLPEPDEMSPTLSTLNEMADQIGEDHDINEVSPHRESRSW